MHAHEAAPAVASVLQRTGRYLRSWWDDCPPLWRDIMIGCIILLYCLRGNAFSAPMAPAATPTWTHPAAPSATTDRWVAARLNWAISNDVPIRTWPCTKYWPGEPSGMGGGWGTAGGADRVHVGIIAASTSYWQFWRGHELWIQDYNPAYSGYCRVADNGPGWKTQYRFDLAAGSVRAVLDWEDGTAHGYRVVRCMVIGCPHPDTCTCDYAVAWRRMRAASTVLRVLPPLAPAPLIEKDRG